MYILDYFEHRWIEFYGRICIILKCLSSNVNSIHSKKITLYKQLNAWWCPMSLCHFVPIKHLICNCVTFVWKKNKTMVLNKSEFFLMQHRYNHAASLAFACSCRYVAPGLNQSDGLPGHPSQFFFRPGATDRQLIRLLTSNSYCNLTGSFKLSWREFHQSR